MKSGLHLVAGDSQPKQTDSFTFKLGDLFIGQNCIARVEKVEGNTLTLVNILRKDQFLDFTDEQLYTTPWKKITNTRLVTLLYV